MKISLSLMQNVVLSGISALSLSTILMPELAKSEPFDLTQTFDSPTPDNPGAFGQSVAISGDNIMIGARGSDIAGVVNAGAAYLLNSSGNLLQTFNNPLPNDFDDFGHSVAISGDNILIGADGDDTGAEDAGSAYLFNSSGALLQTFNNPTPEAFEHFGESVAISGSNILIGAKNDNTGAPAAGSAYLFDIGGTLLQTFNNPTPEFSERFGNSVAISGDNVLIGALWESTTANGAGSAYLFDISGTLLQTFNSPTPNTFNHFGNSVAISGDNILIGEYFNDIGGIGIGTNAGSAYLFDTDGNLLQAIDNPAPGNFEAFGESVAIDGDNLLIGADGNNGDAGSAYLFDNSGNLLQTFDNPMPISSDDSFGYSVALEGDHLLIGKIAGSAYLYTSTTPVPGPLPLLGIGTAFGFSRKLRRRMNRSKALHFSS